MKEIIRIIHDDPFIGYLMLGGFILTSPIWGPLYLIGRIGYAIYSNVISFMVENNKEC